MFASCNSSNPTIHESNSSTPPPSPILAEEITNMKSNKKSDYKSSKGNQFRYSKNKQDSKTVKLTKILEKVLHEEKCYETQQGLVNRHESLQTLNGLVKQWIESVSGTLGVDDTICYSGRIVTYGSYMLGISHQGADIDALCIAPSHITRQEYFTSLFGFLNYQKEITELRSIEEAYVPVIKMRFNGIEIDMTFANLNVSELPSDQNLLSDANLINLDPKCIRSLNGYRSTQVLIKLVPDLENFKITLRAIKLWAKRQGLYSNCLGFLGGFSWAVMVAKTCIQNPKLSPPELIREFFELYSKWKWPNPVYLVDYKQKPSTLSSSANNYQQISSWNPEKNPMDGQHVMPVITPTYPHLNSTYNVSQSTLAMIQDKMVQGAQICERIFNGKETWNTLFKVNRHLNHLINTRSLQCVVYLQTKHILEEFEHLLVISVYAKNHIQWFGLVESKLRLFLISLEKDHSKVLQFARIWPQPFTNKEDSSECVSQQIWFVGLKFWPNINSDLGSIHLKSNGHRAMEGFRDMLLLQSRTYWKSDMSIEASYLSRSELTSQLTDKEFKKLIFPHTYQTETSPTRQLQQNNAEIPSNSNEDHSSLGESDMTNAISSPSYAAAVSSYTAVSPITAVSSNNVAVPVTKGVGLNFFPAHIPPPLPPGMIDLTNINNIPPPSQPLLSQPHNHGHGHLRGGNNRSGHNHGYYNNNGSNPNSNNTNNGGGNYGNSHKSNYFFSNGNYYYHYNPRINSSQSHQNTSPSGERNYHRNYPMKMNNHNNSRSNNNSNPRHSSSGDSINNTNYRKPSKSNSSECWSPSGVDDTTSAGTGHVKASSSNHTPGGPNDLDQNGGESILDVSCSSVESETRRSVSFSSDKFPPPALVQARLQHGEGKVVSSQNYNMYNTYDTSVPPPSSMSASPSMRHGNKHRNRGNQRHHSQRLSSSELRDVKTPLPVQRQNYSQFQFKLNKSTTLAESDEENDSVFNKA